MNKSVEITEIPQTRPKAQKMRLITHQDLLAMGMSVEEAKSIANPDDWNNVTGQIRLLQDGRRRRQAVIGDEQDRMLGFSVLGPEPFSEEKKYINPGFLASMGIVDRYRYMRQVRETVRNSLLMYSLVADRTLAPDVQDAARSALLADVVSFADHAGKEIRGSYYPEDPASELYWAHGFDFVTYRVGRPVGKIDQLLIARPPQPLTELQRRIDEQDNVEQ